MSKDDFVTLHVVGLALKVTATAAGRTVKVQSAGGWTVAQELSRKKVMHEVKARTQDVISIEKRFRNGSTPSGR